jgi:hypothetical protein
VESLLYLLCFLHQTPSLCNVPILEIVGIYHQNAAWQVPAAWRPENHWLIMEGLVKQRLVKGGSADASLST